MIGLLVEKIGKGAGRRCSPMVSVFVCRTERNQLIKHLCLECGAGLLSQPYGWALGGQQLHSVSCEAQLWQPYAGERLAMS